MVLFYNGPTHSQEITINNLSDRIPAKGLVSKVYGIWNSLKWEKEQSGVPGKFKENRSLTLKSNYESMQRMIAP